MAGRTRLVRAVFLSAALTLLAACAQQAPQQVQEESAEIVAEVREDAADVVAPAIVDAQTSAAEVVIPAIIRLQEFVQEAVPEPPVPAEPLVTPAGVALIVRWEVGSEALYARKYQVPIWPGGASGATIGIGDDLGHQTRYTIGASWRAHPQLERLLPAAGIAGDRAKALVRTMRDVRTPYVYAEQVFAEAVLPRYHALSRRAFQDGWDGLSPFARDALVSTVYNRGASMTGHRRTEMRVLRDQCVPANDIACMTAQFRSMCRLWAGTPNGKGLCDRYADTARHAERPA